MIERARWAVAFALRAVADVIEDLADHIDPRPWAGGGALPELPPILARPGDEQRWRDDVADQAAPPFAAHLVADQPPHLAAPRSDRPED